MNYSIRLAVFAICVSVVPQTAEAGRRCGCRARSGAPCYYVARCQPICCQVAVAEPKVPEATLDPNTVYIQPDESIVIPSGVQKQLEGDDDLRSMLAKQKKDEAGSISLPKGEEQKTLLEGVRKAGIRTAPAPAPAPAAAPVPAPATAEEVAPAPAPAP